MFENFKTVAIRKVGVVSHTAAENAPQLYLTAGIVSGIAAAVMAAKAHNQSGEVFEDVVEQMDLVNEFIDEQNEAFAVVAEEMDDDVADEVEDRVYITNADKQKMMLPLYVEMARRAAILYGPSVLMGFGAICLLLASHKTLKKRNRALISTIGLLQSSFAEYRRRVVAEHGEEAEERLYYGADGRVVKTVVEGTGGKKKKVKSTVNHLPEVITPIAYQRVFDDTNRNWGPDQDMNEFFLSSVETHLNAKIQWQGHILLNEVYKALGFAESPEGCVVGWSTLTDGDDYISFGLEAPINQNAGDNRWVLDFNVHGVVFDRIGE